MTQQNRTESLLDRQPAEDPEVPGVVWLAFTAGLEPEVVFVRYEGDAWRDKYMRPIPGARWGQTDESGFFRLMCWLETAGYEVRFPPHRVEIWENDWTTRQLAGVASKDRRAGLLEAINELHRALNGTKGRRK